MIKKRNPDSSLKYTLLRIFLISAILSFQLLLFCFLGCRTKTEKDAAKGVLDLRNFNVAEMKTFSLDGEWEFYPFQYLYPESLTDPTRLKETPEFKTVPHSWLTDPEVPVKSWGTYRLTILLPPNINQLSFRTPDQGCCYRIYVNKTRVAQSGIPGIDAKSTVHKWSPETFSARAENGKMEMLIHVANFSHRNGGLWKPITAGIEQNLLRVVYRHLFLESLCFGIIFSMGLFFLVFSLFWGKDRSLSYFGLLTLIFSFRPLVSDPHLILFLLPDLTLTASFRLEFLSLAMIPPLFYRYVAELFPAYFCNKYYKTVAVICAIFALGVIVLPQSIATYLVNPFEGLSIISGFYPIAIIIKSARTDQKSSLLVLIGSIILFASVIHDIIYNNILIQSQFMSNIGIILFIMIQVIILSNRVAKTYDTVENQNIELSKTYEALKSTEAKIRELNDDLEKRVKQRTAELEKAQKELTHQAHRAGMAEIASGVLHNIGNTLTSVRTSIFQTSQALEALNIQRLSSANNRLKEWQNDPSIEKQQKVREFYEAIEKQLSDQKEEARRALSRAEEKSRTLAEIIITQQTYAGTRPLWETINLREITQKALKLQEERIKGLKIRIETDGLKDREIKSQKTKLIQILSNIIANSCDALSSAQENDRRLIIETQTQSDKTMLIIEDTGPGIPEKERTRVFQYGYTSGKPGGHGFGLHTCALFMEELKGSIQIEPPVFGSGARFKLLFNQENKT